MTAVYSPSSGFWDMPFEISNVYLPTANMRVSAITVGLASNTELSVNGAPNQVRGKIYTFTYNDSIISQLYATTPWINVDPASFNNLGDNNFMEVPFADSIDLAANTPYLVAIENNFGPNHLLVGMSGKADDFTAWHQNSDGYFYVTKIPMIRLQSCFDTTIIYIEDTTSTQVPIFDNTVLNAFPNPTQDYIQIEGLIAGTSYQIFDTQGRIVMSGIIKNYLEKIDVMTLHPGCYLIQTGTIDRKRNLTFIKE
jgi:hypothetical protein